MDLLERIKQIEEEKRNNNISPTCAMYLTLVSECAEKGISKSEVSSELDRLESEGKIERGRTINDQYIKSI